MRSQHAVVTRDEKVAWQKVEDNVVVVTPGTKKIHILAGSGGRLWEYLRQPRQVRELVEMVCREYDVSTRRAQEDVRGFVGQLKDKGIVSQEEKC